MHDIKWIRDNRDAFVAALGRRPTVDAAALADEAIASDERRRAIVSRLQALLERRNAASKAVGQAKAAKDEGKAAALIDEVAGIKAEIAQGEDEERAVDRDLLDFLAAIPNLPADDVPPGADEHDNVERHRFGEPRKFAGAKQHFEIGEALGQMDFDAAAKLSGARFVVLKGQLARLERALGQFMLDLHTGEHGYQEVAPPLLVRDEAMFGTAQLPKFREDQFRAGVAISDGIGVDFRGTLGAGDEQLVVTEEITKGLWLIPTAEVPLTNLVRESIQSESDLPRRMTALTPCFRAEAGAAGRDTRGMIRQHQFTKCELVSITTPEQSAAEHERLLTCAEEVLKRLGLAYRVVTLCAGDMGFAAQKTYDIEVWLPGQGAFREISSCSNCGEFQARRMQARFRPKESKGVRYLHTLNGSGVAVGRALVAVLETYQEEGGAVTIPEVLRPYMGGLTRIEAVE
jgi:seryl-tRNA synthetase